MIKTIKARYLIEAKEWIERELRLLEHAPAINGAELNDGQRESYNALKTALVCVNKELDEMEMEVK